MDYAGPTDGNLLNIRRTSATNREEVKREMKFKKKLEKENKKKVDAARKKQQEHKKLLEEKHLKREKEQEEHIAQTLDEMRANHGDIFIFENIPADVTLEIMRLLSRRDIFHLSVVSKLWRLQILQRKFIKIFDCPFFGPLSPLGVQWRLKEVHFNEKVKKTRFHIDGTHYLVQSTTESWYTDPKTKKRVVLIPPASGKKHRYIFVREEFLGRPRWPVIYFLERPFQSPNPPMVLAYLHRSEVFTNLRESLSSNELHTARYFGVDIDRIDCDWNKYESGWCCLDDY